MVRKMIILYALYASELLKNTDAELKIPVLKNENMKVMKNF
jgi:hypothetical protein